MGYYNEPHEKPAPQGAFEGSGQIFFRLHEEGKLMKFTKRFLMAGLLSAGLTTAATAGDPAGMAMDAAKGMMK